MLATLLGEFWGSGGRGEEFFFGFWSKKEIIALFGVR